MTRRLALASILLATLGLGLAGCDRDEETICDRAWEIHCACPGVTCEGHMTSCTGPDREWAECIAWSTDPCNATCM